MGLSYQDFLKKKTKEHSQSGFEVTELNKNLFPFQKFILKKALQVGRYAIFADTGLGKTIMQLEWAHQVFKKSGPVLVLAPLAVVNQTKEEARKFNIPLEGIDIINYEQIHNLDIAKYSGVVLDESSILKAYQGKMSELLIDSFKDTEYKLCCSATPSPNDHTELGLHSEFLGAMNYMEMMSMFFVNDQKVNQGVKWRLRKHAEKDFWNFVLSWATAIDNPRTFGFDQKGYDLPKLNYIEHVVTSNNGIGNLFGESVVSATDLHKDLRSSLIDRCHLAAQIINTEQPWILWGLQNRETDYLTKIIPNAVNVQGSDSPEYKADKLLGFAKGDFNILVTKAKIASHGMNYQHCSNMIFVSYDFSFESLYQAVRRCYRFGQTKEVNVHLIVPKSQINVSDAIRKKQDRHIEMVSSLSKKSAKFEKYHKPQTVMNDVKTSDYHLMNGDCVERIKKLKESSADLCVFSPPFADIFVYSDKAEDMGNCSNYQEFEIHFKFLIPELARVIKPGRICAIHCMDLPIQKGKEGYIGLRDFSGMLIAWFQKEGFIYHSRATIWKNPVTEMQRTKALGLLHKQIKKDSAMSRVGIPDYILFFRNKGENQIPIRHQDTDPIRPDYLPVDLWQKYASPVWYDINYSRTLQYTTARDNNDERHLAPLQLGTIERIIHLYSNEGETIFSPFGGIGSEGYQALRMNRKSTSIELKESYFKVNIKNHESAVLKNSELQLF